MLSYFSDFSRFFLEILVADFFFICGMERKPHFRRVLISIIPGGIFLCMVFSAAAAHYGMRELTIAMIYTPLSLIPHIIAFQAFRGTFWNRLFCCISGVTLRMCIMRLVDTFEAMAVILGGSGAMLAKGSILRDAIYYVFFLLACILAARYFSRVFRKDHSISISPNILAAWAIVFVLNLMLRDVAFRLRGKDAQGYAMMIFCEFALYALVLYMQYSFFQIALAETDTRVTQELWKEDRRQYEQAKENIEIINIKCHDLRHQLRAARENGHLDANYLEEVERSITIYDSSVRTGNETLDVILTDKRLRCEAAGIQLTCMADGQLLTMMERSDIISLFGNLLENAMEYELSLDDLEKRFISLTVRRVGGFLNIHVENYFEGNLTFRDGLPVTVKEDKLSHGYGLRSIRRIVAKHGGSLELVTEDGMFQANILLPLPQG